MFANIGFISSSASLQHTTCSCPDSETCCQLTQGNIGCCPLENAVCCSDGEHCCPEGSTCDMKDGTCVHPNSKSLPSTIPATSGGSSVTKSVLTPPFKSQSASVSASFLCPDCWSECSNGYTCCKDPSGSYYDCCPYLNGVCCSDGRHCCPQGYYCHVGTSSCYGFNSVIPFVEKQSAVKPVESVKSTYTVSCPDCGGYCLTGETCCEQSTGDYPYTCCSYSNAVCCNDNKSCCPSGYTCSVYSTHCISIEDGSVVPRKVTKQSFVKLPQVNRNGQL